MEDKIILPFFGGVGDSLQFSTLPRLFSELGHKVYLSSRAKFRNEEIRDLVWMKNAYILGESDKEPNAGDGGGIQYKNTTGHFIMNWEAAHGLAPQSERPELYFTPNHLKGYDDKTLIDVTCSSLKDDYDADELRKYITRNYDKKDSIIAVFETGISFPILFLEGYECVFVKSLTNYCDLIYSCEKFVCLHSGGNSLASALQDHKKIDATCLLTKCPKLLMAELNKLYMYDNIKYVWL